MILYKGRFVIYKNSLIKTFFFFHFKELDRRTTRMLKTSLSLVEKIYELVKEGYFKLL